MSDGVYISANASSSKSVEENKRRDGGSDTGGSMVAPAAEVGRSARFQSRDASSTSSLDKVAPATCHKRVPQQSRRVTLTRMAIIAESLTTTGLSHKVAA